MYIDPNILDNIDYKLNLIMIWLIIFVISGIVTPLIQSFATRRFKTSSAKLGEAEIQVIRFKHHLIVSELKHAQEELRHTANDYSDGCREKPKALEDLLLVYQTYSDKFSEISISDAQKALDKSYSGWLNFISQH